MESQSNSIVRWLIIVAILIAVAVGFYSYRRESAGEGVKAEMLAIVDEMGLPPDWRDEVIQLVEAAHPEAFNKALDVTRERGRKFDARGYYDELFRIVIAWARDDGRTELADRLANEQPRFSLDVTER